MKRIVYLLAFIGAVFTGCNPVEDINNSLAAVEEPVIGVVEYTVSDDDYDDLGLGFGSFNSEQQVKDSVPQLLTEKYPYYGNGSAALVTYNLFVGSAEGLSDYTGAEVYEFTNADYAATGSDAFGFYPNIDATDEIPAVLDAQIANPTEGQIVLAKYKQYFETPEVGFANFYENPFPDLFSSYENIAVSGDFGGWSEGDDHANGSAFNGNNNDGEHWLISPEIDLTGADNLKFQINQRISFLNGNTASDYLNIIVSTDYTTGGDPMAATWDVITLETVPSVDNSDFILSENYDFSAYDNAIIHVAFKYEPTVEAAPLWRIDFFNIKTTGVSGDTDGKGEHFVYENGAWEASEGVYYLSSADYDSMGEESGQPGRFDNFSSSTRAENYLPTFLGIKYPFAQEEEQIFVIYKYFSGNSGLGTRGDFYSYTNGQWTGYENVIETSLQFGLDNNIWVPDNTIRYTMSGPDYSAVVSALEGTYPGPAGSVDNFSNFDRRPGNANEWTDDMMLEAVNVVLDGIDAGAAEAQKYIVTADVYTGSNGTEDFTVIKEGGVWIYQ